MILVLLSVGYVCLVNLCQACYFYSISSALGAGLVLKGRTWSGWWGSQGQGEWDSTLAVLRWSFLFSESGTCGVGSWMPYPSLSVVIFARVRHEFAFNCTISVGTICSRSNSFWRLTYYLSIALVYTAVCFNFAIFHVVFWI